MPLYLVQHDAQSLLTLRIVLRSGARDDGEFPGLADMTCDLLSTGAGERNAITFARDVELFGADLGTAAGRDEIRLELGVLSRFFPSAVTLAADMVFRPRFAPEETERERKLKLAIIKQNRSDPDWLAITTLRKLIYGPTPYGHPIDGDERSVRSITTKDCQTFHAATFVPDNGFFVLAGNMREKEAIQLLEEKFYGWPGSGFSLARSPLMPVRDRPRIVIVHRPGSAHNAIRIGRLGVARGDADFTTLRLLNTLFGDYFNSRLNTLLRESMGYTYDAWSNMEGTLDPGLFAIGTSVRGDRVGKTIKAIFRELDRIASEPVSLQELDIVKGYISGRQVLASETPEQIADMVTTIALHNLPHDYYSRTIEHIQSLTPEELLGVGSRYMRSDEMTIVVAGDAGALQPQLEEFGKVEIVDSRLGCIRPRYLLSHHF
ncbi:MAG: insulinase family protein [Chlorobi bacterium]|nr:insulinase family protein [Chlorobiota bacterium]